MTTVTRPGRPSLGAALLSLGLLDCGGPAPPTAVPALGLVSIAQASASASAAPVASPAPQRLPRTAAEPDDSEVMDFARRAIDACPQVFVRHTSSQCPHGDEDVQALALLDHGDRLHKLRTMARLSQRDGEEGQVGQELLTLHVGVADPDTESPAHRSPACADAPTARAFVDAFVAFSARHDRSPSGPQSGFLRVIGRLAGCGDLEDLGLVDRVRTLARERRGRTVNGINPWQELVGLETWATIGNPGSVALRAVFLDELAVAQPSVRQAMYEALTDLRDEPANGAVCAHILTRLAAADEGETTEIVNQFSAWSGPCYEHRDGYLDLLSKHLRDRTKLASADALRGLQRLCDLVRTPTQQVHGVTVRSGMTTAQSRRITDLAASFAGPANSDAPSRAVSLEALCRCDRGRSRALVKKAARSSNEDERTVASSEECR